MKKIFLVLIISMFILGCGGKNESEKILSKIKLKSDKKNIRNNGKDKVIFEIICYDQDGEEMDSNTKLYQNSLEIKGNTFTTIEIGNYNFIAKSEDGLVKSNEVIIIVSEKIEETIYVVEKKESYKDEERIEYWLYEYNEIGNKLEEKHYFLNNLDISFKYEYDAENKLIKETSYLSSGTINTYILYEYDAENNLIKKTANKDDGSMNSLRIYEYDDNNNLLKEEAYDKNNKISYIYTYEYNDENNLIKSILYDPDNVVLYSNKYEYDDENNLIKKIFDKGKYLEGEYYIYKYDIEGNKIKSEYYYSNGELKESYTYEYDENNNLIKDTFSKKSGQSIYCNTYEYKKIVRIEKEIGSIIK